MTSHGRKVAVIYCCSQALNVNLNTWGLYMNSIVEGLVSIDCLSNLKPFRVNHNWSNRPSCSLSVTSTKLPSIRRVSSGRTQSLVSAATHACPSLAQSVHRLSCHRQIIHQFVILVISYTWLWSPFIVYGLQLQDIWIVLYRSITKMTTWVPVRSTVTCPLEEFFGIGESQSSKLNR